MMATKAYRNREEQIPRGGYNRSDDIIARARKAITESHYQRLADCEYELKQCIRAADDHSSIKKMCETELCYVQHTMQYIERFKPINT